MQRVWQAAQSVVVLDAATVRLLNRAVRQRPPIMRLCRVSAQRLAAVQILLLAALGVSGRRAAALRTLAGVAAIYALVELIGRRWDRARPFVVLADVAPLLGHESRRSFPSRHVASAVAMASVAAGEWPVLAGAMRLVAALLALSRVGAGLHYPSDVVAGALLGAAVGRALRRSG